MRDGRIAIVAHRQGDCCAGEVEGSLLPMLWNAGKCQSGRRYDLVEQIAATPSIEQMKTELTLAGWKSVRRTLWKSPDRGYFLGPFGAWKAMKRISGSVAK